MSAPDPERFGSIRRAASRRPHGTRARYVAGCKCLLCRAANSRYSVSRQHAVDAGESRRIVDASAARAHLLKLSDLGVGRRAVHDACDVSMTILSWIKSGKRTQIRANTEEKILAVDLGAIAGKALVPAGPTWTILKNLINRGYSKTQLAAWLGSEAKTPALQLNQKWITAANAAKVRKMAAMLTAGKLSR